MLFQETGDFQDVDACCKAISQEKSLQYVHQERNPVCTMARLAREAGKLAL